MVKAHALYIVLVIALVIGTLSGLFILSAYYKKTVIVHHLILKRLDNNLNSAVELLLSDTTEISADSITYLDLYDEGSDSISISKRSWGIFGLACVKAYCHPYKSSKTFFFGTALIDSMGVSLYLQDTGIPLRIGGNSFLKGVAYVPNAFAERAYVSGLSLPTDPIRGEVKKSNRSLPVLKETDLEIFFGSVKQTQSDSTDSFADSDTIKQSFSESHSLNLNQSKIEGAFKGQVLIYDSSRIYISRTASLDDIIVWAPVIKVESGFVGTAQLFASDSLIIGDNCVLQFPSALVLLQRKSTNSPLAMSIGKGSKIQGTLLTLSSGSGAIDSIIKIEPQASVEGEIYSNGFLEIHNTIAGRVYAKKLTVRTPSAIYVNHLLDAVIDRSQLSPHFVGSQIMPTEGTSRIQRVSKWLK
jgi:cytoskeletal protein CcmA (bactofilin family)